MRSIGLIFILLFSAQLNASCDAFERVKTAGLYESEAFWEDFAKLSTKGQPSDAQIAQLISKHQASGTPASVSKRDSNSLPVSAPASVGPRAALVGNRNIKLHRDAEKGLGKALPQVQTKFDTLVRLIDEKGTAGALQELRGQRSWNLEAMRGQPGLYSIRLNEGYRATFTIENNVIHFRNLGQHIYKH